MGLTELRGRSESVTNRHPEPARIVGSPIVSSDDRGNIENDVPGSRFVLRSVAGTAELTYGLAGSQIILKHTEVPKALRGGGIAGKLAKAALDYAGANNL